MKKEETIERYGKVEYQKQLECNKKWRDENEEKMNEMRREWREGNPNYDEERYKIKRDEIIKRATKWNKENKEKHYTHTEAWRKKHPEYVALQNHKRRELGFIPINSPFKDSEGHHLDKAFVLYIPKELHKSVYHNVYTEQGMEKINDLAFQWLQQSVI